MGPDSFSTAKPRRLRSLVLLFVLAAVVCAVAIAVAAETLRIESVWTTEAPIVDGKLTEWSAPLIMLGSTPLSLGVRNDGRFVYVALASSDEATRMMLGAAGFTVWMDPSGKNKKSFGVTVPPTLKGPGMRGRGAGGGPPGQYGQPPDSQGAPPQGQPGSGGHDGQKDPAQTGPGGVAGLPIGTITSIEVAGASKDDKRRLELAYARTIGIDVATRAAEGVLVYELKMPLAVSESQPYGVKSSPGATIGLGIETAELARPEGRGEGGGRGRGGMGGGPPGGGGGGMGGGGMMGGGGGQPGGMGGGPAGGGREGMREPKPIKVWAVVQLAKPPA